MRIHCIICQSIQSKIWYASLLSLSFQIMSMLLYFLALLTTQFLDKMLLICFIVGFFFIVMWLKVNKWYSLSNPFQWSYILSLSPLFQSIPDYPWIKYQMTCFKLFFHLHLHNFKYQYWYCHCSRHLLHSYNGGEDKWSCVKSYKLKTSNMNVKFVDFCSFKFIFWFFSLKI